MSLESYIGLVLDGRQTDQKLAITNHKLYLVYIIYPSAVIHSGPTKCGLRFRRSIVRSVTAAAVPLWQVSPEVSSAPELL